MPTLKHVPVSLEWCILKRGEVEVTAILKSTGHTSLKVLRGWNEKADFEIGADHFSKLVRPTAEENTRETLGTELARKRVKASETALQRIQRKKGNIETWSEVLRTAVSESQQEQAKAHTLKGTEQ